MSESDSRFNKAVSDMNYDWKDTRANCTVFLGIFFVFLYPTPVLLLFGELSEIGQFLGLWIIWSLDKFWLIAVQLEL